ncbi:RNA polymerase sigma factor SigM [Nocardioides sp. GY 10113]|nr:RNA polymerase sigma factor SigM [Nocardioides sp. GY 10113]
MRVAVPADDAGERSRRTPEQPDDPEAPRSDADLLADHVAGDPEAFGILFRRHRDRLWAVALRTTGDPDVAADGLQDGMVAAFRRAGSFRGEAQVTTWLHRVVVNACLDRLRAARVRRAEPLPELVDDREALRPPAAADETTDPLEHQLRAEQRARVRTALATLPAEQRAALVLVDMEGYSVAEAAVILDCAEGTIKSRCSRGRARLAVLLQDLLTAGEGDHPSSSAPGGNAVTARDVRSGRRRGPPDGVPAATTTP